MPKRSLADEKNALEQKLADVDRKLKQQERERLAVLGAAVSALMKKDADLKSRITAGLDQSIKAKGKRALLGLPVSGSTGTAMDNAA